MGRNYLVLLAYILTIFLLEYLLFQILLNLAMKPAPEFPFIQFSLILFLGFSLISGVAYLVKKYIHHASNGNKKLESNLKRLFGSGTVIAVWGAFAFFTSR
ncbi:hypothetical protein WAK64_19795 [Bacillus spongiae]|uniref:Uncharacterized protein n=1 Tax=Bacillus spongiae TaxID=2683610 RepID=A0ABU8HJG1_9BACI